MPVNFNLQFILSRLVCVSPWAEVMKCMTHQAQPSSERHEDRKSNTESKGNSSRLPQVHLTKTCELKKWYHMGMLNLYANCILHNSVVLFWEVAYVEWTTTSVFLQVYDRLAMVVSMEQENADAWR